MAAAEEVAKATYEQLSELEKKFEDVEVEISKRIPRPLRCPRGN